jgi:hypothetical protein
MPGFSSAQRFDVGSASWVDTGDATKPGAYRLRRGFEVFDAFRSESDCDNGTTAKVSVYLSKHLAAHQAGKTLGAYLAQYQTFVVPRGADLPGLYERAVVLMSGQPPAHGRITVAGGNRNCLKYPSVDQANADLLRTLLTT